MENFTEEKPKDYVIATGQAYSVREFINIASNFLNMKIYWTGRIKGSRIH